MSARAVQAALSARLGRVAPPRMSTGLSVLDGGAGVRAGELVEVVGASCAGKTQVLHAVAAGALARGRGVCWVDLGGVLIARGWLHSRVHGAPPRGVCARCARTGLRVR